jgi:hypothetical protein
VVDLLTCGVVVVAVDPAGSCRRVAAAGQVQTRNEQVAADMEERQSEASHTEVGYADAAAAVVAAVGTEHVAIAARTQDGQVEAGGHQKQNEYDENHIVEDERSVEEDFCCCCCCYRSDHHGGLWICLCLDDTNRCCRNENDLCHRGGRGY